MSFSVDPRLEQSSLFLCDAPLSRVYLKNEATFPWLILVPRLPGLSELHQLRCEDSQQLMWEIGKTSELISRYFKADKINVGALGNIVQQLHIHVIARYKDDPLWPHSVWQPAAGEQSIPYDEVKAEALITALREEFACLIK
ncbi:HIT domain-containing protein [Legionella taurinensis]|uniref:Diadenosine tetraphosphatase n=1 Tax=Legionella taurinensis TaxID=70611 RepID=A0A3A5LAF4_9GAMM|nr:HIT family protein [Legionella taurinensis]MDX1837526.1 HIT family protein [Legionella taurinensis]PUT40920.1 diadenosine tetraphosphatase [Legionella taurinensis]PUT44343.1 diadenosine tetraphosphatase [Legionella taurinensis]PUT47622.1 diadenosine tetraphosphatase [Legionella taurinensis]PUT48783.1 diadenosine tetraphosphatase [Legionella taurinensis]